MQELRITIKIICLAALGIGIVNSLVSDKSRAKSIKFVTGLIFLILIINLIFKIDYNFDKSLIDYSVSDYKSDIDMTEEILILTQNRIAEILKNELHDRAIEIETISVICDLKDDGSVSIASIDCKVANSKDIQRARKILSERTEQDGCLTVTSS